LRSSKSVTVLSGPNNGGKTILLKHLFSLAGHGSYLVGCNRFSHVDVLNSRQREQHEHRRFYENFMNNFERSNLNTEDNEMKLDQVLTQGQRVLWVILAMEGHLGLGRPFGISSPWDFFGWAHGEFSTSNSVTNPANSEAASFVFQSRAMLVAYARFNTG
jgi:hypothetical protein